MGKPLEVECGQQFGRWTVLNTEYVSKRCGSCFRRFTLCKCQCGTERLVGLSQLASGMSKSCGCLSLERMPGNKFSTKHGNGKKREYRIYTNMIRRCYDPKSTSYPYYGGRGILVCNRWRQGFELFFEDMGPANGMTLERRQNDGHYEPGNCEWATNKQQRRNTRRNKMLEMDGKIQCLSAWCEEYSVPYMRVFNRLKKGWSLKNSLTAKVLLGNHKRTHKYGWLTPILG